MRIVFWQNIISLHQSSFLNALSRHHEVILVVEEDLEKERMEQGWSVPVLENVLTIVSQAENRAHELLDKSAVHVFSGLAAYPMVSRAFGIAVKNSLKVGVMMEPFNTRGIKGMLRWLKYGILKYRFSSKVDFFLPTGDLGTSQYTSIGFDKSKIFEWAYFVDLQNFSKMEIPKENINQKPSLLFVGSIDHRKNILPFINKIKRFHNLIDKMTIVGDGPLKSELTAIIKGDPFFDFRGVLLNTEVKRLMASHDILILPSKFDGWGAVVNEALHAGMRVIASENCGASILLDGKARGEKFNFEGDNKFEKVLLKWLNKGKITHQERRGISEWSNSHLSGEAAAKYFESILEFVYKGNPERPSAPWRY